MMAIRRCPYCKAIIDESQKYCNNCGTQLLFPQDEEIEEDIKGEKIRDDDFRDAEPSEEEELPDKEEIDLEKLLEADVPFPDDLGEGETDEIELSSNPIITPAPKPRAEAKPKAAKKSAARPAPGPKPEPEPEPSPLIPAAAKREEPPAEAEEIRVERENERSRSSVFEDADEVAPEEERPDLEDAEAGLEPAHAAAGTGSEDDRALVKEPEESVPQDADEPGDEEEMSEPGSVGGREDEDLVGDKIEDEGGLLGDEEAEEADEIEEAEEEELGAPPPGDRAFEPEDKDAAADDRREKAKAAEEAEESDEYRDEAETRAEIARLIAALEKKHKKIPLSLEEKKIIAPLEETSGLPAWAQSSKITRDVETEADEETGRKGGAGSFAPGDTMDFEEEVMRDAGRHDSKPTIGIPETLSKIEIPGRREPDTDELEETITEEPERKIGGSEPDEAGEDETEPVPSFVFQRRLGFFGFLRAAVYDLFFVALLWFAGVWLASRILTLPVFSFVTRAAVPLGLFFGVLLLGYLFLFLFFLGETLGRRLVASKD